MLYIRDGFPEVNENVLCVVTKIYGNTVFVHIPEYEKDGVLTISEIAPGRIRNLKDYVIVDKRIICKVLRVDSKSNRIDVSLRRVNLQARKEKTEELKKEEFAEKVYEDVAKQLNISKDDLFDKTYEHIFEEYDLVFDALYDIMLDSSKIDKLKHLSTDEKQVFLEAIHNRIKPEKETLRRKFSLYNIKEDGVVRVRESISKSVERANFSDLAVQYIGAGEFEISITHETMKDANLVFKTFKSELEKQSSHTQCELELV
ncbi:MAG: S1 RNA-binding domain-containing protein [Candidatus Nanoarchaeia archaeon]